MGSFLSLDLFLFFVFFEIVLVPMYFLIGGWGYDNTITNGAQLMELVSASKSLVNNKSLNSQIASLQIQSQAANNNIKSP